MCTFVLVQEYTWFQFQFVAQLRNINSKNCTYICLTIIAGHFDWTSPSDAQFWSKKFNVQIDKYPINNQEHLSPKRKSVICDSLKWHLSYTHKKK